MKLLDAMIGLRTRLNDTSITGAGEYSDADIKASINNALKEYCTRFNCYETHETGTTVNSKLKLNDIHRVISVIYNNNLLKQANTNDRYLYYDFGFTGTPGYYIMANNEIDVFPVTEPNEYAITVIGYASKQLKSEGDTADFIAKSSEPFFLKLCEIYARETRPSVDNNINIIQLLRQEVDSYFARLI